MKKYRTFIALIIVTLLTAGFYIGFGKKDVNVSAATGDTSTIVYPQNNFIIPAQFNFRGQIKFANQVKTATVTYTDLTNKPKTVTANLEGTTYFAKITDIALGKQSLTFTVEDVTGFKLSQTSTFTVSNVKTNILTSTDPKVPNVEPYIIDKNQMKNYMLAANKESAGYYRKIPKTSSYVDMFINTLIEEAAVEGVRPDIVLAQILLETGNLTHPGDVFPAQNNYGGIGATGNGVSGNYFDSIRLGIRVNIQHLLAYSTPSTFIPKNAIVDPRFYYVNRGISPSLEELGAYENINRGGWAYSPQYGQKILGIMTKIKNTPNTAFVVNTAEPIDFNEFSVKKVFNNSTNGTNPLDMIESPNILLNDKVRMAIAATSDVEAKFDVVLNGVSVFSTPYSADLVAYFIPKQDGIYTFTASIRKKGATTGISNSKILQIGGVSGVQTISFANVTMSSSPYYVNQPLYFYPTVDAAYLNEAEYKLQEFNGTSYTDLTAWSNSQEIFTIPSTIGTHKYKVVVRNKLNPTVITDFRDFSINVVSPYKPLTIESATMTSAPYTIGTPITVTANLTYPEAYSYAEFRLEEYVSGVLVSSTPFTSSNKITYTPGSLGNKTIKVVSRNSITKAAIEGEQVLEITVQDKIFYDSISLTSVNISGPAYTVGTPITFNIVLDNPVTEAYAEFRVEELVNGLPVNSTPWSKSLTQTYTPTSTGNKTLRIISRNETTKTIEDSKIFILLVK